MFGTFFKRDRGRKNLQTALPDVFAVLSGSRARALPCAIWTDFGIGRAAEIKEEHPSPLALLSTQKARA
jgi:hypothetical protein